MKTNQVTQNQQVELNELTPTLADLSAEETQNIHGGVATATPTTTPAPTTTNVPLLKPGAIKGMICWY